MLCNELPIMKLIIYRNKSKENKKYSLHNRIQTRKFNYTQYNKIFDTLS